MRREALPLWVVVVVVVVVVYRFALPEKIGIWTFLAAEEDRDLVLKQTNPPKKQGCRADRLQSTRSGAVERFLLKAAYKKRSYPSFVRTQDRPLSITTRVPLSGEVGKAAGEARDGGERRGERGCRRPAALYIAYNVL